MKEDLKAKHYKEPTKGVIEYYLHCTCMLLLVLNFYFSFRFPRLGQEYRSTDALAWCCLLCVWCSCWWCGKALCSAIQQKYPGSITPSKFTSLHAWMHYSIFTQEVTDDNSILSVPGNWAKWSKKQQSGEQVILNYFQVYTSSFQVFFHTECILVIKIHFA